MESKREILEEKKKSLENEMMCLEYLQVYLKNKYNDVSDKLALDNFIGKFDMLTNKEKTEVMKQIVSELRKRDVYANEFEISKTK